MRGTHKVADESFVDARGAADHGAKRRMRAVDSRNPPGKRYRSAQGWGSSAALLTVTAERRFRTAPMDT
jgi:hypothetical protein